MHYLEYREDRRHGTPDYKLQFYRVTPEHPRYRMSCHWHMEYEIIRVIQGRMEVFLDRDPIMLTDGDLLLLAGGTLHSAPSPENCHYECLVFDTQMLRGQENPLRTVLEPLLSSGFCIRYGEAQKKILETAGILFSDAAEDGDPAHLRTVGGLYRFFADLAESGCPSLTCTDDRTENRHAEQLKLALSYIEQHYTEQITLADLADAAGLSPKYFCRVFVGMTHRTPIEYLNDYRIERACHALTVLRLSPLDTAYSCGFNDLSYFIKVFKRQKGMTPGLYRKTFCFTDAAGSFSESVTKKTPDPSLPA